MPSWTRPGVRAWPDRIDAHAGQAAAADEFGEAAGRQGDPRLALAERRHQGIQGGEGDGDQFAGRGDGLELEADGGLLGGAGRAAGAGGDVEAGVGRDPDRFAGGRRPGTVAGAGRLGHAGHHHLGVRGHPVCRRAHREQATSGPRPDDRS